MLLHLIRLSGKEKQNTIYEECHWLIMNKKDLNKLPKDELIRIIESSNLNDDDCKIDSSSIPINYKTLLEATSDIIIVIDKNENLVYTNNAWRTFYPSMKDVSKGEHYSKYIPEVEKERASFVFHSIIKEGKSFENEMIKTIGENGEKIYFITSFSPIRGHDNVIIGLLGIMKNITERHLMEKRLKENTRILEEKVKEQLAQSEELRDLRDLNDEFIKNAPIGIFMMDRSGIMLSENAALVRIMGRTGGEAAVGVNLLDHPGFIEAGFGEMLNRVLEEKKTITIKNAPYVPLIGDRELIINVTMTPILDKTGSVDKAIVMIEDNTEQARITKRINRTDKLSALGFLAGGVASKLTDPINRMYMDLNFVENNINKDSPAYEYTTYLKKELHIIKNMSEQLLALAGPEEGDKEICEINKVITTHPMDVLLNRLQNEGIDINLVLPSESPRVKATSKQLKQVLYDIIENAEEAMPEKDGKLDITMSTMDTAEGQYAIIDVTDSGIGIPQENLNKIFQPFYSTKGAEATGLGLMISSNVIENLGGSIGVKSKPGMGTSIKIALPVVFDGNGGQSKKD